MCDDKALGGATGNELWCFLTQHTHTTTINEFDKQKFLLHFNGNLNQPVPLHLIPLCIPEEDLCVIYWAGALPKVLKTLKITQNILHHPWQVTQSCHPFLIQFSFPTMQFVFFLQSFSNASMLNEFDYDNHPIKREIKCADFYC